MIPNAEFKKFVKDNTEIIMLYKYPCVLEWDENIDNGDITDILPKERCPPEVDEGYQYRCMCCEEMYLYFTEYLEHMEEEFVYFTNEPNELGENGE